MDARCEVACCVQVSRDDLCLQVHRVCTASSLHIQTQKASTPVKVSGLLACRDGIRLGITQLHQLHEQVRLRQAKQGVNQRKVWLIKVKLLLQTPSILF